MISILKQVLFVSFRFVSLFLRGWLDLGYEEEQSACEGGGCAQPKDRHAVTEQNVMQLTLRFIWLYYASDDEWGKENESKRRWWRSRSVPRQNVVMQQRVRVTYVCTS